MKPPDVAYLRPRTTDEAVAALERLGGAAKVLAGGQSLVPALNMRLLSPDVLVDVNYIEGLDALTVGDDGVRVGALVRQERLERSAEAAAACPILRQALVHVAHSPLRTRGTVVGSLVHADPAAELPAVLAVLGGSLTVAGPAGERRIASAELFAGPFETTLRSGELAVAATFPALGHGERSAFAEVARRHGDFAICAVAAVVSADRARVGLAGVDPVPRVFDVTGVLAGGPTAEAALDAVAAAIEPGSDVHASADYRRHLARELTRRAVAEASR